MDARASNVADTTQTEGIHRLNWTSPPQWSPESDGLLVSVRPLRTSRARDLCAYRASGSGLVSQCANLSAVDTAAHDRVRSSRPPVAGAFRSHRDAVRPEADRKCRGALRLVIARRHSAVRLRRRTAVALARRRGTEIGWPISYTPPMAEPTLIRNVRIIDGTGRTDNAPRDILIERGRIARIAPAGGLSAGGPRCSTLQASRPGSWISTRHISAEPASRFPLFRGHHRARSRGLHGSPGCVWTPSQPECFQAPESATAAFSSTVIGHSMRSRDAGSSRRRIRPHRASRCPGRGLCAQHIKTRTFRRWDINARMITEAHRRGMRATGHCAHLLPLVAAMDAKEHTVSANRGATPTCMMT